MFHTSIGVALLAIAVMLMAVGSLWMSKIVKVEA
jgi:Flp pilus assembly protein TadB